MPSAAEIKRRYRKETERILALITRRDEASIREAHRALKQFRKTLNDRFWQVKSPSEAVWFLRMQKAADDEIAVLEGILRQSSARNVDEMTELGEQAIREPLSSLGGIRVSGIVGLDRALVTAARNYSADLISLKSGGLTSDILKSVNTQISLGQLGAKPVLGVIEEIAALLKDGSPFFARAEMIFRTEGLTISSLAQQSAALQANEIVPMMKTWIWSGISRTTHEEADGQMVPVDEPFKIRNEKTSGYDEAMFPRDPNLPPEQRINCGCAMATEPDFEALAEAA